MTKPNDYQNRIRKIGKRFLTNDELILLDLLRLDRSTKDIATFLSLSPRTVRHRKRRLETVIRAYSWWLDNEERVAYAVKLRGRAHWRVFEAILHRRPLKDVARREGISESAVRRIANEALETARDENGYREFANALCLKFFATRNPKAVITSKAKEEE